MSKKTEIYGLAETLRNLGAAPSKILAACKRGQIRHAVRVQRGAQKKTPIDYGNLRASAFIATSQSKGVGSIAGGATGTFSGEDAQDVKKSTEQSINFHEQWAKRLAQQLNQTVFVGFGAYYAFFVHESTQKLKGVKVRRGTEAWHTIWGTGEPKFLEKADIEAGGKSGLQSEIISELKKVLNNLQGI